MGWWVDGLAGGYGTSSAGVAAVAPLLTAVDKILFSGRECFLSDQR